MKFLTKDRKSIADRPAFEEIIQEILQTERKDKPCKQ